MKSKYILVFLLLAIAVLLLWRRSSHPANSTVQQQDVITTNQANPAPAQQTPSAVHTAAPGRPSSTPENNTALIENRIRQMKEADERTQDQWRTPIEFFGKVVDETGAPVEGSQVSFSCNDVSETGTSYYRTVSGGQGLFSIRNITGKLLTVHVSKDGYYSSKRDNDSYYYAGQNENFRPDANNPVVFHLRKQAKGESLITSSFPGFAHIAQLRGDGTAVELDLLKGAQVSAGSGQLKLEFWRDVSNKNARVFDWKLQLYTQGGGLIQTTDEFAFQAPDSGYQPSIVIDMPATNQNWQGEVRSKYYIQLPDGKYGRIDFYLLPYNGVFTLQSAINPDGSRNLEPAN
jgi:hypothetical protein